MKKSFQICFIVLILIITLHPLFSTQILLDDLTIDTTKNNLKITIHNLQEQDINTLQVLANNKKITNFSLKKINTNKVIGLLLDNSGSIILKDFYDILDKVNIFIKNMSKKDQLIIWKVNNSRTKLYGLSAPNPSLKNKISSLIREGQKSRILDSINESFEELKDYKSKTMDKNLNFYLVLFSDGEDIGSKITRESEILNSDIPFYYFSYPSEKSSPKTRKNKIYRTLSDKTNGKVIKRPTEDSIKKIFFQNENRYEVSFYLTKKSILNSKSFEVIIKSSSDDKSPLRLDLKKYFNIKSTFTNWLIWLFVIVVLLILLVAIFLLIFFGFLKNNKKNLLGKKQSNDMQNNLEETSEIKDKKNITTGNKNITETKEAIDINALSEGEKVYYQERGIIYKDKAKVQREIEKSKKVYIDKPDNFGETIIVNTKLIIKDFINGNLVCKSKRSFLLDETLTISKEKFTIVKIVFIPQGKSFVITLQPHKKNINLPDLFSKNKEIEARRVIKIFGSNDSVIEKIALQNYQNRKREYSKPWRQASIMSKTTNSIEIKSNAPLSLDSTVALKYINGTKELFFKVKKVKMINETSYRTKLIQ